MSLQSEYVPLVKALLENKRQELVLILFCFIQQPYSHWQSAFLSVGL